MSMWKQANIQLSQDQAPHPHHTQAASATAGPAAVAATSYAEH